MCIHIYIYIYRERERYTHMMCIYVHVYMYACIYTIIVVCLPAFSDPDLSDPSVYRFHNAESTQANSANMEAFVFEGSVIWTSGCAWYNTYRMLYNTI